MYINVCMYFCAYISTTSCKLHKQFIKHHEYYTKNTLCKEVLVNTSSKIVNEENLINQYITKY